VRIDIHGMNPAEAKAKSNEEAAALKAALRAAGGAQKHDAGKGCRPGLIAPEMLIGMGKVLAFGAGKYAPGNWALGMDWSRPIDALERHWLAWKSGEARDPETGFSHLLHMGCCLMFLIAYEARGIGRDDRAECGLVQRPRRE